MAQKCNVCNHKSRRDIDRQIVKGIAISQISREFGVSEDSIRNHRENHITRQMAKAVEIKEQEHGIDVLGELNELMDRTKNILTIAEDKKQNHLALQAIGQLNRHLELLSKIKAFIQTREDKLNENNSMESVESLNAEAAENLLNLDPTEKEIYFQILFKLLHGGDDRIENIEYPSEDAHSAELNGFQEEKDTIYASEPKTPNTGLFVRTKKSHKAATEQDVEDSPMRVKTIEPTEISCESKKMTSREIRKYWGM